MNIYLNLIYLIDLRFFNCEFRINVHLSSTSFLLNNFLIFIINIIILFRDLVKLGFNSPNTLYFIELTSRIHLIRISI